MYGCESWTVKKAERWRIDAFELWCWRRLWRFLWTSRRSNLSILKEISPEYSLEGLMLKGKSNTLATWCKEPSHWNSPRCWERLTLGGEGDNRGWDGWMASLMRWTWVWVVSRVWWWTVKNGVLQSMGVQRVGHHWATELNWLSNVIPQGKMRSEGVFTSKTIGNSFTFSHANLLDYWEMDRVLQIEFWRVFYMELFST